MAAVDIRSGHFTHHIRSHGMRPHLQPQQHAPDSDKLLEKLRDPRLTDLKLTEEDLGIFEDTAVCADLSDSDDDDDDEDNNEVHVSDYHHHGNQQLNNVPDYPVENVSPLNGGLHHEVSKISYPDFTSSLGRKDKGSIGGNHSNSREVLDTPMSESQPMSPPREKKFEASKRPTLAPGYTLDHATHLSGFRGKTNTPMSYGNDSSARKILNRGKTPANVIHHIPVPPPMSRRQMRSRNGEVTAKTPLVNVENPPFASTKPQVFYIKQMKPAPMEDLKAWRGYHGNVYFEPIHVNSARFSEPEIPISPMDRCTSQQMQKILSKRHRHGNKSAMSEADQNQNQNHNHRNNVAAQNRVTGSPASLKTTAKPSPKLEKLRHRQMSVLDKDHVIKKDNLHLQEDLTWIVGQESTGSLKFKEGLSQVRALQQRHHPPHHKPPTAENHHHHNHTTNSKKSHANGKTTPAQEKDRLHKGSMAHHNMKTRRQPLLSVHGDNFTPQSNMSPLLRTTTQYSLSSQRMTMNSPDLYNSFSSYDKLPPLEQLRASLRHIDSAKQDSNMVHMIPPLERMKFEDPENSKSKPFVKYTPEIRTGKHLGHHAS